MWRRKYCGGKDTAADYLKPILAKGGIVTTPVGDHLITLQFMLLKHDYLEEFIKHIIKGGKKVD